MKIDASIILLIKNGGERLRQLMDNLQSQKFNGNFEIIAIDSGSEDESLQILEDYDVQLIQIKPEEFHHSRTRNLGAEKSKGDVLIYLTQDALPVNNDLLETLITPLTDDHTAICYGRQEANPDAKITDKFFYSYFYPNENRVLKEELAENQRKFYMEHIYISDVCAAIKKEVWNDLRFTDDVGMSEDKDFALKVLKEGYQIVYQPDALVYHSHNYSLKTRFKRRFQDGAAFSTIALEGEGDFLNRGTNFIFEETKFLIRNKHFIWVPYAFLYNFMDFLGFSVGKNKKFLPGFLKNTFE